MSDGTPTTLLEAIHKAITGVRLAELHDHARLVFKDFLAQKFCKAYLDDRAKSPEVQTLLGELFQECTK